MSRTEMQTFSFPRSRSPTKDDLKPNPHPYAIQTSSSAVLSRSNSSPQHYKDKSHHYIPNAPTSPTQDKGPRQYKAKNHGHHYTNSFGSDGPRPLPTPPTLDSSPSAFPEVTKLPTPRRSKRADTLPSPPPSAPPTMGVKSIAIPISLEDLPPNPKLWSPAQLSNYLATALRVRTGEALQLPTPIAKDIAAFIRSSRITGKVFLRFNEEDLEGYGMNKLWRTALLTASRNLRQNVLKGRIWGFDSEAPLSPQSVSDEEDEDDTPSNRRRRQFRSNDNPFATVVYSSASSSSSTEDLGSPLTGRLKNGRVKGMVASFERSASFDESDQTRPEPSLFFKRREGSGSSSGGSDSGVFESALEDESVEDIYQAQRPSGRPLPTPPPHPSLVPLLPSSSVPGSPEEPSMEDLLASTGDASHPKKAMSLFRHAPRVARTGVHAWEAEAEQEGNVALVTVKHLPRTEPATISTGTKVGDIFTSLPSEGNGSSSVLVKTDVGRDPAVEVALLEAEEKQLRLSLEATRSMIDVLGARLKEVEGKVAAMELHEEERMRAQALQEDTKKAPDRDPVPLHVPRDRLLLNQLFDSRTVWGRTFCNLFGLPSISSPTTTEVEAQRRKTTASSMIDRLMDPKSISALPPYIILVGLGVCAVVLRVVFRRRAQ